MCCDLFILYIHFHVVCYLCVKFTSHLIEKKTVTEPPCNIFVYLSVNLLLGNIRMSLLMLRNYIKVYTGCTSLLTDHTAYSQLHHDDAIFKRSGISS